MGSLPPCLATPPDLPMARSLWSHRPKPFVGPRPPNPEGRGGGRNETLNIHFDNKKNTMFQKLFFCSKFYALEPPPTLSKPHTNTCLLVVHSKAQKVVHILCIAWAMDATASQALPSDGFAVRIGRPSLRPFVDKPTSIPALPLSFTPFFRPFGRQAHFP